MFLNMFARFPLILCVLRPFYWEKEGEVGGVIFPFFIAFQHFFTYLCINNNNKPSGPQGPT